MKELIDLFFSSFFFYDRTAADAKAHPHSGLNAMYVCLESLRSKTGQPKIKSALNVVRLPDSDLEYALLMTLM